MNTGKGAVLEEVGKRGKMYSQVKGFAGNMVRWT